MISSTPKASAVRNGEANARSSASISCSRAFGSGAACDLAPECGGHTAFDRQRAPFGGRPRNLEIESVLVGRAHAGHAVALAHHHGVHRHGRLQAHVHRAHAFAQGRRHLRILADHEARHVDEKDQRDMEAVAHLDEMDLLARRLHVHGAAVDHRVVGDDADHLAVHARKARDQRLAEGRLDLEEGAAIDDVSDQLASYRRDGVDPSARC